MVVLTRKNLRNVNEQHAGLGFFLKNVLIYELCYQDNIKMSVLKSTDMAKVHFK